MNMSNNLIKNFYDNLNNLIPTFLYKDYNTFYFVVSNSDDIYFILDLLTFKYGVDELLSSNLIFLNKSNIDIDYNSLLIHPKFVVYYNIISPNNPKFNILRVKVESSSLTDLNNLDIIFTNLGGIIRKVQFNSAINSWVSNPYLNKEDFTKLLLDNFELVNIYLPKSLNKLLDIL